MCCAAVVLPPMSMLALADQPSDPLAGFDEYAAAALADWRTPGMAVAIIKDGKVILARGYGVLRVGGNQAVDAKTVFPIASVTKAFTATCLAQLHDDGRLKWDDPVAKHFPEFELSDPYLTRHVRIADLLSHRTGLETADLLAYRGDYDRREILRRVRFLKPVAPFRSRYVYNNLMYVAAGELLERVTGEPWPSFVKNRLLKPLEMNATFTSPRELDGRDNVSTPHLLVDERIVSDPAWRRDKEAEGFRRLHDTVAPAGAIQSNVLDMAEFIKLHLAEGTAAGRRLLKTATVREMQAPHSVIPIKTTPQPDFAYPRFFVGAGLGWILRDYRGRKVVYHGGSSGAVAAFMPEENLGVAVLANRGCGIVYMVMHDTFDRLLGVPRNWTNRDWLVDAEELPNRDIAAKNAALEANRAKDTKPSLPLSAYVGIYECDLYGKLSIVEGDGALRLQFGQNTTAQLRHWEHDAFRARLSFPPDDEWLMRFVLADGKPDRVEIQRIFWHEPMPVFRRIAAAPPAK
jgi:CubicO group peptidase (beta-lactamase class C family)